MVRISKSFFSLELFNVGLDHPGLAILTQMVQYHLSKLWWVEPPVTCAPLNSEVFGIDFTL